MHRISVSIRSRLTSSLSVLLLLGAATGFGAAGAHAAEGSVSQQAQISNKSTKGNESSKSGSSISAQAASMGLVTLRDGKELIRDGDPWYPKGMTFFGRLIPKGHKSDPGTMYAQRNFGQKYMDALKWFGGDTVRLQIGLPFLDPKSPYFNKTYIDEVAEAVSLARTNGMTVILSMQWQERVNVPEVEEKMPGPSTLRAWEYTAPKFAKDAGVLYELYNEPTTPQNPSKEEWLAWQKGHQAIVDMIRQKGIKNILIVEGPTMAKLLSEDYPIKDPLNQTAYAIHPRLRAYLNSPQEWDERFGNFANSHAVIATEWGHGGITCKTANGELAGEFLKYLEKKNIGLIGWGMENKNSKLPQIVGNGQYKVSTFKGRACEDKEAGPGEDMRALFQRKLDKRQQAAQVQ